MAKVLARVTAAVDAPRGPDALHRVRVPRSWVLEGATIELDLPRNLACAACDGGGCDACDRSGAVSSRGRKDAGESVRVTLPTHADHPDPPSSGKRGLVVRIPERGGLPPEGSELPRGNLLLAVLEAQEADPGVRRVEPIAPLEVPLPEILPPVAARRAVPRTVVIAAIVLLLWVAFLVWLRLTGRG